jgi:hypothetical protein
MDLPTTIMILLVGAAIVGWVTNARDGRALEAFGLGFIGYRSYGWPRGVQEEDEIHFSFGERPGALDGDDETVGPVNEAELIELPVSPDAVRLERLR